MMQLKTCPSVAQWQEWLSRPVAGPELESLTAHLEGCDRCTRTMDDLLSRDSLAEAVRAHTVSDPTPLPLLGPLIARLRGLRNPGAGDTLPAGPGPAAPTAVPDFLSPARGPNELGWLGPFRVLKELGAGGMGLVFLAEDTKLERSVALKVMRPELAKPEQKQRFLREARAAAKVQHDHVVTIYQVGEQGDVPFLAMQLLEGESLDAWLERGQTAPAAEAARVGREVADGLAAAHERGLIHRDIKPANLWLEAGTGRVKILDFGLARATSGQANLTSPGAIVGTPAYASPEQFRGEAEVRSDLFSLGAVLYRLCTGRPPFQGDDLMSIVASVSLDTPAGVRDLNPDVPPALADLVTRLLAKDPNDRPASARDVADRLAAIERDLRRTHPEERTEQLPSPGPAGSPPRRRRRRPVVAAALLGGLFLAAGAWVVLRDRDGKEVARVKVPEGGAVELKQDQPARGADAKAPLPPLDPAWVKKVQALPAPKQVTEVFAEVRRRNPGFDPEKTWKRHEIEGGVVTSLWFLTDNVADISPVRVLTDLRALSCYGTSGEKGLLTDLSPLKGTKLTTLYCSYNQLSDLSPLEGLPLTELSFNHSRVSDLSPLKGMPLTKLNCDWNHKIDDLSPLKGMPLTSLSCTTTRVSDLSPLRGMKLTFCACWNTQVTDLSPLKGMPLRELWCPDYVVPRHAALLRSFPGLDKVNGKPTAEVLK